MNRLGEAGPLFDILITLILADLICGSVLSALPQMTPFAEGRGHRLKVWEYKRLVGLFLLLFFFFF